MLDRDGAAETGQSNLIGGGIMVNVVGLVASRATLWRGCGQRPRPWPRRRARSERRNREAMIADPMSTLVPERCDRHNAGGTRNGQAALPIRQRTAQTARLAHSALRCRLQEGRPLAR